MSYEDKLTTLRRLNTLLVAINFAWSRAMSSCDFSRAETLHRRACRLDALRRKVAAL